MARTTAVSRSPSLGASSVLDALQQRLVLGDGAMGTMLVEAPPAVAAWASGLAGEECEPGSSETQRQRHFRLPEELNETAPELVLSVHRGYLAAGAEVLQTNSFGASAVRLAAAGLAEQAARLTARAAALARDAAARTGEGRRPWVAGSIGPCGRLLAPVGDLPPSVAARDFAAQAATLAAGGVDLLIVETMSDTQEARLAIEAAKRETGLPVIGTMSFDVGLRTAMGATPEEAVSALSDAGADAVGANCSQGPRQMLAVVRRMRAARPDALLAAQPNAGRPRLDHGRLAYDCDPAAFAALASEFRAAGVRLLGSCCGTTPAYTAAIAAALRNGPPATSVVVAGLDGGGASSYESVVARTLRAAGYNVVDLGPAAAPAQIVVAVVSHEPHVVCLLAFGTASLPGAREVLDMLENYRLRERVRVLVCGAAGPLPGADAYVAAPPEVPAACDRLVPTLTPAGRGP